MESLSRLRIADLQVFIALAGGKSLADVGATLGLEEARIAAALGRLEEHFGAALVVSSEPTERGRRLLPQIELVVEKAMALRLVDDSPLTVAAPSFIAETFLPLFATRTTQVVRGLRVPPEAIESFAADRIIDAAVSIGIEGRHPLTWSSELIGEVHYGLFASPTLARSLGPSPTFAELRLVPFVTPVFVSRVGVVEQSDDRCPIGLDERDIGHEVETFGLGCRVAAETDQLVYGPLLAAAPFVREGVLVELDVPGIRRTDPLFLACSKETVSTSTYEALAESIRSTFTAMRSASAIIEVSPAATVRALGARHR